MTSRACAVCHRPTGSQTRRCAIHAYKRDKSYRVTKENRALVYSWVGEYGLVCPGLPGKPTHNVANIGDLTVHHVVPLARGGHTLGTRLVVCRSCNSAVGAR